MLEYMKEERYKQEVKNEAYRMSIDLFTKYGGWVNNLQIMYEQSAKNAKAELQNILDAFLKTTKTNHQTPIYGTFTLPKEYKLPNKYTIQEFGNNLKEQKKELLSGQRWSIGKTAENQLKSIAPYISRSFEKSR